MLSGTHIIRHKQLMDLRGIFKDGIVILDAVGPLRNGDEVKVQVQLAPKSTPARRAAKSKSKTAGQSPRTNVCKLPPPGGWARRTDIANPDAFAVRLRRSLLRKNSP